MNKIIYQIFPRNYSQEGTLKAVTNDLNRIKELGIDIIYLMPINEIGIKERKGTFGSPYASKDYFSISKDLGTIDDLKELINKSHNLGMKVILDMVFNHTSPDNDLLNTHPEYYYYKNGKPANKIGDWSDIIDLETTRADTQDYLLSVLKYWQEQGIDGFRFDVASIIPDEFFVKARKALGKDCYFLAESVSPDFFKYLQEIKTTATDDFVLSQTFDCQYNYNYYHDLEWFLKSEKSLQNFVDSLNAKDNKLSRITGFENHDRERIYAIAKTKKRFKTLIDLMFVLKGTPFIYAGMEIGTKHKPELFEKDPINWSVIDKSIYSYFKSKIAAKRQENDIKEQYFKALDDKTLEVTTTYFDGQIKKDVFVF